MPLSGHDAQKLGLGLLRYASSIDTRATPDDVLDALHKVTAEAGLLNVLGAYMFPLRWGEWERIETGKTIFLHKSVPDRWWAEYNELKGKYPNAIGAITQLSMSPFTMSEIMRTLEPLGVERWPFELAMKYGIRDSLTCPVGGRWAVVYWSRHVLSDTLTPEMRAMLFMGASFAAIRLQKLVELRPERLGDAGPALTARELSVLRLTSMGYQVRETAEFLGLGEETVRSHLKKAQAKLDVRNRLHAVAQAIRRHLIP